MARRRPEGGRPNIKDVAKAAGVSIAAVSYALNDTGRLADETRERIIRIATELGYRPSARGRLLAGGSTRLFAGVASFDRRPGFDYLNDPVFSNLYLAGARWFSMRGYALAVVPAAHRDILDMLPVDGLILLDRWVDDGLEELADRVGAPTIEIMRPEGSGIALSVGNDDAAMFGDAVDHLVAAGSRRPGLLLGPEELVLVRNGLVGATGRAAAAGVAPVVVHAGNSPEEVAGGLARLRDAGADAVWSQVGTVEQVLPLLAEGEVPRERVLVTSEQPAAWPDGTPAAWLQPGVLSLVLAGGELLIDVAEGRRTGPERIVVPHTLHAAG